MEIRTNSCFCFFVLFLRLKKLNWTDFNFVRNFLFSNNRTLLFLQYSSLPAPPFQHLAPSLPAEVTPPMPECLTKPYTQAPMPSEPTRLAEKFTTAPTLPSEPVQLAQKFSVNAMPSEPMSLVDKFVHRDDLPQEPQLLRQQFDLESRMTTAPSFGEKDLKLCLVDN